MLRIAASTVLVATLAACSDTTPRPGRIAEAPATSAMALMLGANSESRGTATIGRAAGGTVVLAKVEGLAPGTYAMHLHAVGKCEGPKFTSAGDHFNPGMKLHGKDNPMGPHVGDLPNVVVGAAGRGTVMFTIAGLSLTGGPASLLDADGASIIVHAAADDYRTDPGGNSGDRIACGVVSAR